MSGDDRQNSPSISRQNRPSATLKDDTFALLKKNVKITKERIPSATQLFTPDWIVRYMVENSLGRIYVDKRKNEGIYADGRGLDEMTWHEAESERIATEKLIADKMGWKYYLPEAEQTQEVRKQLDEIQNEYATLDVKDIKVIDPCMGSGHILVYAFDVLMQIYEATGYSQRDAAQSILENNLYGLDIDDRAAQLAYFAVMMKARQYDRRIFSRGIQPHVYAIVESNGLDSSSVEYFTNNDPNLQKDFGTLMDELRDAKEYGSILNISQVDFASLYARVEEVQADISMFREIVLNSILPLIQVAEVMAQRYDVVVTNPPYMGSSGMGNKLSSYVKKHFPNTKSDMSTVFMEQANRLSCANGYTAMINIPVWMFLSSYAKMRGALLHNSSINTMLHLGRGVFGADFGTTAFVIRSSPLSGYKAVYRRLFDSPSAVDNETEKQLRFFSAENSFCISQDNFLKVEDSPIVYWLSDKMLSLLSSKDAISLHHDVGSGLSTADNERFLRFHWEVAANRIGESKDSPRKWFHFQKGGEFRRWYGNLEYVVNWENDGSEIKYWVTHNPKDPGTTSWSRRIFNVPLYFQHGITWAVIGIGKISFRETAANSMISNAAGGIFSFECEDDFLNLLGGLNTKLWGNIFQVISPTVNYSAGIIQKAPVPKADCAGIVRDCIAISRNDWDTFEVSWGFKRNPLLIGNSLFAAYTAWKQECEDRFQQLKKNEEEINRIFIDIYGLQDELTPDVADRDVTVHRVFDSKDEVPESMKGSNYVRTMRDEIVSLISYAVGCMFGRYSLDKPGLVFAGYSKIEQTTKTLDGDDPELEKFAKQNADGSVSYGSYYHEVNQANYKSFPIDTDNIIPICDDDYFDDDITGRFVKWVETVYGKETLEENLKFIADALGGKGMPREVIRSYFLNDFYADHLKTYQKRPIYWLFDSGKKNGFKALVYMHRYQSDLLARMRTDYVHEQQERYRTQLTHLADAIEHAGAAERVKLTKQQKKLQEQALEIQKYEEKIHHLADQNIQIDLDDGVKHNYELFADVLAKIK